MGTAPVHRTSVAIVDDHLVFAEALAQRLRAASDIEVVGVAPTARHALELFAHHPVEVLLLDLDLGGDDGLELCRRLLTRLPDLRVVVVTASIDGSRVAEALQVGVLGWVDKYSSAETLLTSLRATATGQVSLPARLLSHALRTTVPHAAVGRERSGSRRDLTPRELEVLRHLQCGQNRKEVADSMHISPNTVRTHVQSILHKLDARTTVAAVSIASRSGVLPPRSGPAPPNDVVGLRIAPDFTPLRSP